MDLKIEGRSALVTGSYRGTGAGIAKVLASEGASVLVHGMEAGAADDVVREICDAGGKAHAVTGDIRNDEGAEQVVAAALEIGGRVDILVNNYGVAERGSWHHSTADDWIDMYQKNVLSGVRLVAPLVPAMKEQGWGRVIWVGTVGATRPAARMPHYYASKATLMNITVSLCKELAGTGITVNTVSPGLIATREVVERFTHMAKERGEPTDWASVERTVAQEFMSNPSGRVGTVEEVGHLIAFLASDLAGYVNGANLRIDGGGADTVN